MEYLSSAKNPKYHLKSALVTFGSTFILMLVLELSRFPLSDLKPEDITFNTLVSGAVMFARLAFVAILKTGLELLKKIQK